MNFISQTRRRLLAEMEEDERTDVQKLHDACRLVCDRAKRRNDLAGPDVAVIDAAAFKEADQAADRAYSDLVWLLEKQFGDEVDCQLLAKALSI